MTIAAGHHSEVLAAMADGIGDLPFASEEWVAVAAETLAAEVAKHAEQLRDINHKFTLCEVAHNAPAYLHVGAKLAWHARMDGASVTVASGELPVAECDLKIESDHAIMSNLARVEYHARNPTLVTAARERLVKLSRWQVQSGTDPLVFEDEWDELEEQFPGAHPPIEVVNAVWQKLHDTMAPRTLPRFVFMTPEWVSVARHILSERAVSERYASDIQDVVYTFSEEFTETPRYAFPDGTHGGFWVRADHGTITVGAGPLPKELGPADALTKGPYGRVIPVGRTVDAALTDEEKAQRDRYAKLAFSPPEGTKDFPVSQTSPSGKGRMPEALMRVFAVLHDELSKRTSGELPSDFEAHDAEWAKPQPFDRQPGYDASWLCYDKVDIYGNPR